MSGAGVRPSAEIAASERHHVSCWEDHRDDEGNGSTCLLPDGHEGPHDFTPDSEITVRFFVVPRLDGYPAG